MKLSGWGRYPALDCEVSHLRGPDGLEALFARGGSWIARGAGRAYGDAALNPDLTVSMLDMNRLRAFDPRTGVLECEAGVLLADILEIFVPRGWFPPVVPGTKFVTVGGMIAADVHGKNHHREGSFGAHVDSLTLAAGDGEVRECSRAQNAALFRATLGGMGLTGAILSARFRMKPIDSAWIAAETLPSRDLDETMASFEASAGFPYSVAWIDCLARGRKLGRALVTRGAFMARGELPPGLVSTPLRAPSARGAPAVPFDAPAWALNRFSVAAFNELYYRRGARARPARAVRFDRFFFPLDGIGAWNRLYGRRGFVQYQCVFPRAESAAGLAALLERVAASRRGAFLAVLKLFGAAGEGPMSFPMEGYTLALDFPMRGGTLALLDELDGIVHERGGRLYLAKDARCSAGRARQGYPHLEAFRAVREETSARTRFASALSRRLAL